MARTPLLRSLIQLSRAHLEADRRGQPVEAVREQQALSAETRKLGRRTLLGTAAAGAAVAALPSAASAASTRRASPARIAIVGAGISGLNCALTLADRGYDSTIYEASGRIGGRMYSNTSHWADGQVSEWGGELIDTGHTTVRALSARFGLDLVDLFTTTPGLTETYRFFSHYYTPEDADRDFQALVPALKADLQSASYPTTFDSNKPGGLALDAMSVYQWIETRVPGGHSSPLGALLDIAYNIEYGAETTDQSSLNLLYLLAYQPKGPLNVFGESDEKYHIVGGNQQLPQRIADSLGNVEFGHRLTSVRTQSDGSVALTFGTSGGAKVVTCDYAVLTLPFAVLRTLDTSGAGFDARKNLAIQQLGRGSNGKLQLQFNNRVWRQPGAWGAPSNGATYADTGYQATWEVTRGQTGQSGILVKYTGGTVTDAMETSVPWATQKVREVQKDASRFLQQIGNVYPGLGNQWSGKATSSLPKLDPNFNCSYSYWRVGQYAQFVGYEGARQGNILFAGEHTSLDFQGFMEGGASEGERAARDLLKNLP